MQEEKHEPHYNLPQIRIIKLNTLIIPTDFQHRYTAHHSAQGSRGTELLLHLLGQRVCQRGGHERAGGEVCQDGSGAQQG